MIAQRLQSGERLSRIFLRPVRYFFRWEFQLVLNKINKWHTGTIEHRPLPSPPADGNLNEIAQSETPVLSPEIKETQVNESQDCDTPTWYDRVQERLGEDRFDFKPASRSMGPQHSPRGFGTQSGEIPLPGSPRAAAGTLARMATQTQAIADSVNVIDHQFKLQVLGRLGRLEKQLSEFEESLQRTRDACKGIESKLQYRKGVPCDMLERLDSMSSFTYAFCKSMEDAGVFQMRKK